MISPKELVRNHLLAATMNGRWETITEIGRALRKDTGTFYARADVWKWMRELSIDGVHTLEHRQRALAWGNHNEYQLHVKPEKVGVSGHTKKFFGEYLAKQDYLDRQAMLARRAKSKA